MADLSPNARWHSLNAEADPPKHWSADVSGWYRHPATSRFMQEPLGMRRMRQMRYGSPERRREAIDDFAAEVCDAVPEGALVTYAPSSTRRSIESDAASIEHLLRREVLRRRSDVAWVELLIRETPVPCVHEERCHDVSTLRSSLRPSMVGSIDGTAYVLDNFVATGATFAATRLALASFYPRLTPVLMAYVFKSKPFGILRR